MSRFEISRRDVLKLGAIGGGLSLLPSCTEGSDHAADSEQTVLTRTNAFYDAVIQVFFSGGPSQTDTLDPKPGSVNNVFGTINLGVSDKYGQPIYLSSVLPKTAAVVQAGTAGLGLCRSLVHTNGDHSAAVLATQSFWKTIGPAMLYPSIGSVMAFYFQGLTSINIPAVAIDGECNDNKGNPIPTALNGSVGGMNSLLTRPVIASRYDRRKQMLDTFNAGFLTKHPDVVVQSFNGATQDAYKITTTGTAASAFDLTGKTLLPSSQSYFSKKLTLAQELVKAGVPYVALNIGGNDSHTNNKATVTENWGNAFDPAVAQLVTNLQASGKKVLILFGGEFGRTPQLSTDPTANGDGRDHWFDGFSWGMLSVNQSKFKTGAIGDTGPDGLYTQKSTNDGGLSGKLVDAVELRDLGALVYRSLGFQVGDATYNVPLISGSAPPVDPTNNSSSLMSYFGLV